jgi:molecular chaperone DnaK
LEPQSGGARRSRLTPLPGCPFLHVAEPLSEPTSSRASGVLRIHATDDCEFAEFVRKNSAANGLTIAHPNPPPVGTSVRLEVLSKETKERICAVDVVVRSIVPPGEKPSPSMVLSITAIALGCSENVRQALAASMPHGKPLAAKRTNDGGRVIGIDLGTTFSCAAVVENDAPMVIQSRLGYSTIPSILTFDDQGVPVVGQVAERRLVLQPDRVVYGSKRLIGRTFSNAVSQAFSARVPYKVVADSEGMSAIQLGARVLSPVEIAACVLSEVRRMAEEALQEPVTRAVVTVPAAFTQNQRAAVREAGARAGLDILRTVNEPTAATLAFGYGRGIKKKVLVFDLGGGTFDVSILDLAGNVSTVLATVGDTFLGGLDFDEAMVALLMGALREQFGNVRVERPAAERIRAAAREAKHALSETKRANVAIPKLPIEGGTSATVDFSATVAREQFEAMTAPLIDRTIKTCEEALAIAKLGPSDIEDVLLVGGQTRMPAITQRLQAYFKRPPSKRVHPDEVVALGAALLATTFERENAPVLLDVLSTPIGFAQPDGTMRPVLARNVRLPATATVAFNVPAGIRLEVAVFQGDSMLASENEFLGALSSDAPADGGAAPWPVELTFRLDEECILTIRSKDLRSGKEVEHSLTTRQTRDDILARLGRERLGVRQAGPEATAKTRRGVKLNRSKSASSPKKRGFFARLFGG